MALTEKWKNTYANAGSDARWNAHDTLIQQEVAAYNKKFGKTTGYVPVDWRWIKAMVWVESGGPDAKDGKVWTSRPMQIGNAGDAGMSTLTKREEGSDLVMSDELFVAITQKSKNAVEDPNTNIRAGIAYLFTQMMKSEYQSVVDESDSSTYTHAVRKGETFATIAQHERTTVAELKASNPTINPNRLSLKATLQFRHARTKRQIIGWRTFDFVTIAAQYNGGGDKDYVLKLDYVWKIIAAPPKAAPVAPTPSPEAIPNRRP